MSLTYTTTNILCAATDVGMHGLLASQSCYHSVLPPSLWFSGIEKVRERLIKRENLPCLDYFKSSQGGAFLC